MTILKFENKFASSPSLDITLNRDLTLWSGFVTFSCSDYSGVSVSVPLPVKFAENDEKKRMISCNYHLSPNICHQEDLIA